MVKQTQRIRQQIAVELFECVWHFVGLELKGLNILTKILLIINYNNFNVLNESTQYIKNFFQNPLLTNL